MSRAALEEAYRRTSYDVRAPEGTIRLRIGERPAMLDALLERHGAETWAFITAWNPGSFRLPRAENERSNRDLQERLLRMGYTAIPGAGTGDDEAWEPEESFFVPGIPRTTALELGRFYRQMAIVAGTRGARVELLWC